MKISGLHLGFALMFSLCFIVYSKEQTAWWNIGVLFFTVLNMWASFDNKK